MAPAAFNLSDSLIDDSPQKWFISAACVVRVATARVFTVERSMRSNRSETNNATVDAKIKKKSPFTINKQKIPPSKAPIEEQAKEAVASRLQYQAPTTAKRDVSKMSETKLAQAERLGIPMGMGRATTNKNVFSHSTASSMQEVEQVGCVLNCAGYSRHESLAIPSLGYLIVSSP